MQVNPRTEITRRIGLTCPTLKKLDLFWNQTRCNRKWKLIVLNAVVVSKVLYGLEHIEATNAATSLLDIFHLKGLRKFINMQTTFINRLNTNETVYNRANDIIGWDENSNSNKVAKIIPLSDKLTEKKLSLLGHVLRRPPTHPSRQVTFATSTGIPRATKSRRVGRPRVQWAQTNMSKAWTILGENNEVLGEWDINDRSKRELLFQKAIEYKKPFS